MPRLPPPYPRFCSAQLLHTFSMVQAPPTPTECCADLSRFRRGGKARPPCRHISAPESASPPGRVVIDGSGPVNVLLSVLGPGSPCDRSDPCLAFNPVVDGPGDHRGGTVWEPPHAYRLLRARRCIQRWNFRQFHPNLRIARDSTSRVRAGRIPDHAGCDPVFTPVPGLTLSAGWSSTTGRSPGSRSSAPVLVGIPDPTGHPVNVNVSSGMLLHV